MELHMGHCGDAWAQTKTCEQTGATKANHDNNLQIMLTEGESEIPIRTTNYATSEHKILLMAKTFEIEVFTLDTSWTRN